MLGLGSILATFCFSFSACDSGPKTSETQPKSDTAYQIITGDDQEGDKSRWNTIFDKETYVFGKEPAEILKKYVDILPVGRALDIAMSEGRNGVYLAKKGFNVDGVDISEVALRKAKRLAKENHVSITTINADLNHYQIRPETYEVIVNIDFLLRTLVPQIKKGLKRGGVVVFENATVDQLNNPGGQSIRRDFLLGKGELKELFKDFQIVFYEETNDGKHAIARMIAMKP